MTERLDLKRVGLAFIALAALVMAMVTMTWGATARADHLSTWPWTSETNHASYWETWGLDQEGEDNWTCDKEDNSQEVDGAYTLGNPPSGEVWRLLVVKAGSDHNDLYWNPIPGQQYAATGQGAGGWSHVILCSVPADQETTTTTVEETTTTVVETTTNPEETTTTTEETTTTVVETTTVPEETTTTVEETTTTVDVLDSTVTTEPEEVTTVAVEDSVLGTEVLPFTGVESEWTFWIAVMLGILGALLVVASKRVED